MLYLTRRPATAALLVLGPSRVDAGDFSERPRRRSAWRSDACLTDLPRGPWARLRFTIQLFLKRGRAKRSGSGHNRGWGGVQWAVGFDGDRWLHAPLREAGLEMHFPGARRSRDHVRHQE